MANQDKVVIGKGAKAGKAVKDAKDTKDAKGPATWGSEQYLRDKFDDIVGVSEMTRKCKGTKAVKALVAAARSGRDNLGVHRVYRATFQVPGEDPREGVIAWISFGLNGGGSQADYLDALRRLVESGELHIFDCVIDAVDDVADVLCTYLPKAEAAVQPAPAKKPARAKK